MPCLAQASCGDWLAQHEPVNFISDAGASEEGLAELARPVPIQRLPCDGPGCRQAPAAPGTPADPIAVRAEGKTLFQHRLPELSDRDSISLRREELDAICVDGFFAAIERPPKSSQFLACV